MRSKIAIGLLAAALLGGAPAAIAALNDLSPCATQAVAVSTPLSTFRLAACRFWQCNCRSECIRWDQNGNCTGTYRTCDTCSSCDD